MNDRRFFIAAVYIAAATAILAIMLLWTLSGGRAAGEDKSVSDSGMTVTGTDSTTADVSEADLRRSTTAKQATEPQKTAFVRVADYIPEIEIELIYATDRNFTGKIIYDFSDAWLRYGTVQKLAKAQEMLKEQGAHLKIWDAFRPVSAQYKLWDICPDPRYVANPEKGYSSHSRGNTVDITLVDREGNELAMPTGFDDFTRLADRDYSDVRNKDAVSNAKLLEKTMKKCGFRPYQGEWWHFSDSVKYDVATDFVPE